MNPHRMPMRIRALDLLGCLVALPLVALGVLVMTGITRYGSPGPVLFRQVRVGYRGRSFMMFKFRTMTVNADQAAHQNHFKQYIGVNIPMVKLDAVRDARLIPGGWLLRATGLDELPQIINVIRGDMSLVGPRPCLPSEFADYMPAQRERVNAVPGLTGLWQVSGKNRTTFAEMIRLDIHYARHTSLLLNLRIIALTPLALGSQVCDTWSGRQSHLRRGAPRGGNLLPLRNAFTALFPWRTATPAGQRLAMVGPSAVPMGASAESGSSLK